MTPSEDDARKEAAQNEAYARWMRARVAAIHKRVSAADILAEHGIRLRYGGSRPEQVFCPFHGNTRTMAARYHPEDEDGGRAGIWCFGCNKRFDAISLWKGFHEFEGSFGSLLRSMERAYGLVPPEAPPDIEEEEPVDDTLPQLFDVCERRLKNAKRAFTMEGFLTLSSLLDRLLFQVENRSVRQSDAHKLLRKILDRIQSKERECPEG